MAPWQSVGVSAGAELSFAGARDGMRAYLGVAGGIDVPLVLGSRSTHLKARLGGFMGRALAAGDRVPIGPFAMVFDRGRWRLPRESVPVYGHTHTVRVVMGPQDDAFTDEGIQDLPLGALRDGFAVRPCRVAV